jgi:hypothetical protein
MEINLLGLDPMHIILKLIISLRFPPQNEQLFRDTGGEGRTGKPVLLILHTFLHLVGPKLGMLYGPHKIYLPHYDKCPWSPKLSIVLCNLSIFLYKDKHAFI